MLNHDYTIQATYKTIISSDLLSFYFSTKHKVIYDKIRKVQDVKNLMIKVTSLI